MPPFWAHKCKCCGCVIGSDDFNRANSDDISTGSTLGWTEAQGNGTINSNKLRITTADTILFCDTESTTPRVRVTLGEINFSANNAPFRFFFNAVDVDNWWALQIDAGSDPGAKIVQAVAGVETELHAYSFSGFLIDHTSTQTLNACITSFDQLVFAISGVARGFYDITSLTSGKVGLGTSSTFSGTLDLDDFTLDRANDAAGDTFEDDFPLGLPNCQCIAGVGGCPLNVKYPFVLRVVLAGLANGTCGSATTLNGTYDCEFYSSTFGGGVWTTIWRVTFSAICGFNELRVYMDDSGGGILEVRLLPASGLGRITWDGFDTTTLTPGRCVIEDGDSTVSTNVEDTTGTDPFDPNGPEVDESASTATISIP
jgi:hypothetical protein